MASEVSRRTVLSGIGAGVAQVLLTRRMASARALPAIAGEPGLLDLTLTAVTPRVLRIGIAPVNTWASAEEWRIRMPRRWSTRRIRW